ncbi:MAG: hypothetical protein ACLVFO_01040 [Lactobacillus iners]
MNKENFHNDDAILDVYEKPNLSQGVLLSLQHLFAMFGSTVLTYFGGLDPALHYLLGNQLA